MPTARSNANTRHELLEDSDNTAESNVNLSWNRPSENRLPTVPSYNHPLEERREEDTSVADTFATVHYNKESREDKMDRQKEMETALDSEQNTELRDNVNISAQYVKSRHEILDRFADLREIWYGRLEAALA